MDKSSISLSFTLVQLVDAVGSSRSRNVLVAGGSWGIVVGKGISVAISISRVGKDESSIGFSLSFTLVKPVSTVSAIVVWVAVAIVAAVVGISLSLWLGSHKGSKEDKSGNKVFHSDWMLIPHSECISSY